MKKRFLPISLLLTIIILAQTSFVVNANGNSGKYTPRSVMQPTAQSFMKSIRANQETGLIDPAWLVDATKDSQSRGGELNWTALGPDNYGSLTRAIIYDNQDATNKTLYIGTMGGGIFKSVNGGITWKTIGTNLMVSCIAQTEDGTIYVGTGDGRGAHEQNGLSDLNYENSFIGSGIYKLEGETLTQIETSTFVNDLAVYGNKVYAATNEGLKCYDNAWTTLVEGEAYGVEVYANGDIIAVVGSDVYMTTSNGLEIVTTGEENMLPAGDTYKMVATSTSDNNYAYVAYLTSTNGTGNIYMTSDHGATWQVAYTTTTIYDIFGSRGLLDNAFVVYPNDPRKILIGGLNLWVMQDQFGDGIFRLECLSNGNAFQIAQSSGVSYYNYSYIHSGIQSIVFNPNNVNEFFVGSEGGVFKGTCSAAAGYQFEGMNRYMFDADNHTSVARMFNVAFTGKDNNASLGASLDHGTIHIIGDATINAETQAGNAIFPNDNATTNAAETYGAFDFTKAAGPCAMSTINPNAMYVTVTGGYSIGTPLFRTQTEGVDYDKENFSYSATESSAYISNSNAFRTPIALFENYNDVNSPLTAKFYAREDYKKGDTVLINSNNADYPFEYVLTENLQEGDSIEVQDIVSSTFMVAVEGSVYMTRDALMFDRLADWWKIGTITGIPNALSISADGDVAYVGTIEGNLYKYENLSSSVTSEQALGSTVIPSTSSLVDSIAETTIKVETLGGTFVKTRVTPNKYVGGFNYNLYTEAQYEDMGLEAIVSELQSAEELYTTYQLKTWEGLNLGANYYLVSTAKDKNDVWSDTIKVATIKTSTIPSAQLDATAFEGRAITSIAIDPENSDNIIVTLGNYGNADYVYYSTNGGESFTSKQGNLPAMPVYSSIIEKTTGKVILGTENGIYTSDNMSTWTQDAVIANIPVMDIKQQTLANRKNQYIHLVDEVGDIVTTEYPGIFNEGVIYIATYGRGLYKCDTYKVNDTELNVEENIVANTVEMSIYPNPIVNDATISFSIEESAQVSYQVYDLSGRMMMNKVLGNFGQGSHKANFNVENLTSGTYIIKVQAGEKTETAKILVY